MKILLSPSKTMNVNNSLKPWSYPIYQTQANAINRELLQLNVYQLRTLYNISESLANNVYNMIHTSIQPNAAIGYYKGEAYRYLDGDHMVKRVQENAQKSLRILCAMYGYLKPFDAIKPYRMDFLVDFRQLDFDNNYSFWKDKVTSALLDECLQSEIVFNLASKEFSSVVNKTEIMQTCHWVDVDFLIEKDGKFKTVSMLAKKARGLYARALLNKPIDHRDDIFSILTIDDFILDKSNSHLNYLRYIFKKK